MCHYFLRKFLYLSFSAFISQCYTVHFGNSSVLHIWKKICLNIVLKMWFSMKIFKIKPKGTEWTEIEFWFCADWKLLLYNSHFSLLRYHNLYFCLPLFSYPSASFQKEEATFLFLMGVLGLSNDKTLYISTKNHSFLTWNNLMCLWPYGN